MRPDRFPYFARKMMLPILLVPGFGFSAMLWQLELLPGVVAVVLAVAVSAVMLKSGRCYSIIGRAAIPMLAGLCGLRIHQYSSPRNYNVLGSRLGVRWRSGRMFEGIDFLNDHEFATAKAGGTLSI